MKDFTKELKKENDIALKVGTQYIIINMDEVLNYGINITVSGFFEKDNNTYVLYKGISFEDSQKIDKIFDSRNYDIKNLNNIKLVKEIGKKSSM